MNEIILNDESVAAKIAEHNAELEKLRQSPTVAEAEAELRNLDNYDLTNVLPHGTIAGEISRAKKNGVAQAYGFVRSGHGDVFVPPSLMDEFADGERVACLATKGPKGLAADKIAGIDDFIDWHREEILSNIVAIIKTRREDQLKWYDNHDPSHGWEEMKAKCAELGLQLLQICKLTKSLNYGGRGTDSYEFATAVTHEQAEKVLDVLGTRHASTENPECPYDHGHDNIRIKDGMYGFDNDWCGPWTD